MFASYKPGTTTLRSLTSDDVEGVCAIYPNDQQRVVDPKVSPNSILEADTCSTEPRHGFTKKCEEPIPPDKGCSTSAAPPSSSSSPASAALVVLGLACAIGTARRRFRR
jgi:MYXO-CTERM domain-containing protein